MSSSSELFDRLGRNDIALCGTDGLFCACGYIEASPASCCPACGNEAIRIDSQALLGTLEQNENGLFVQEAYLFGYAQGPFLDRVFRMRLELLAGRSRLILNESDRYGKLISRVEAPLSQLGIIELGHKTSPQEGSAQTLPLDAAPWEAESHTIAGFARVWAKRCVEAFAHERSFENVLQTFILPGLDSSPLALSGLDSALLQKAEAAGVKSMEQFLSKVMLEGADDPSIKEAFLQSAGEMSDRGDVLNLNAARVIISVFSNATLVRQLLQNLDRLKPIFNLKTSLTGVLVGALNEMTAAYDERVLCDAMLCDGFWGERVNDTIALLEKGSDGIFWPVQFAKLYPILYERHFASDLLEAEGDRPLNFEKEERRFEGSFEGMVFRLPANIREFVQRGPPQHTVLTDRLERFGYGQLLVLAVYEAGQHRYTCDITPQGELLEIRSHNQQALTSQVIMKIGAFLDFVATRAKTI